MQAFEIYFKLSQLIWFETDSWVHRPHHPLSVTVLRYYQLLTDSAIIVA